MERIDTSSSGLEPLLLFAGDLYIGESTVGDELEKLDSLITYFINSHKIFCVNVEAPICKGGLRQEKYSTLKMDPEKVLPLLRKIGIKVAFLANNHIMDYGDEALSETISNLSRLGVSYLGAGSNINEAFKPLEINIDGVKITLINFTTVFTLQSLASIDRAGIAGLRYKTKIFINPYEIFEEPGAPYIVDTEPIQEDLERILSLTERSSESSDLTIVYVHWGVGSLPYSKLILRYMRMLSSMLIDKNVDIIIGSHPHILLHSEKIKGGLAIYSLGNFIFTYKPKELLFSNVGGMLSIWHSEKSGEYRIYLLPIRLDNYGLPRICSENYSEIFEVAEFMNLSRSGGVQVSIARWEDLNLLRLGI